MTRTDFTKSSLFGWCLFDFANSIPAVIGGVYFAKWYTDDLGAGSIAFNLIFIFSSAVIMLTGRWVGHSIDKHGYKYWIKLSAAISIISILLLFVASQVLPRYTLPYVTFILFLFFLFGYQVGRICHNTYLRGIIPERLQTKMSGLGAAANWAGSIVGILLTIPVVTIYTGSFARELTFLVAGVAYGVLMPLSLVWMFRSDRPLSHLAVSHEHVDLKTWRTLIASAGLLLLTYLFLFDVMATVQRNLPPFLSNVYLMSDDVQAGGFLLILVAALLGGVFAARFVDFTNSIRWLRLGSVLLGIGILLITINATSLWIAFVVAGFSYGLLESAIRVSFMARFSSESAGENFGVLAIVERTSSVVGPMVWIIPFYVIANENSAYIYAMLSMAILVGLALTVLSRHPKSSLSGASR
jgi:MFS-type transporter involved in bile tolerance (Atg22 family)